jgi:hypothetical protein
MFGAAELGVIRKMVLESPENVIGYDAREMWRQPSADWDWSRRQSYLIDTAVSKPLSVDTMVWASVFDGEHNGDRWKCPEMPEEYELWPDYEAMFRAIQIFGTEKLGCYWGIALTVLPETAVTSIWEKLGLLQGAPKSSWELIGYDVADEGFISALSNCGYFEGETKPTAERLYEHHLFSERSAAEEFRTLSNHRVSEHAPFFVFGIYRLHQ